MRKDDRRIAFMASLNKCVRNAGGNKGKRDVEGQDCQHYESWHFMLRMLVHPESSKSWLWKA